MEKLELTILKNLIHDDDYARKVIPFINVCIYKPEPPTNIGDFFLLIKKLIILTASKHHFSTLNLSLPFTYPYK